MQYCCYYYFTRAVYRPKEGTAFLLGGGLALRPSHTPVFVNRQELLLSGCLGCCVQSPAGLSFFTYIFC